MRTIAFAVFGAMMSFAEDDVPKEGPHTRWPAWYQRQRGLQVGIGSAIVYSRTSRMHPFSCIGHLFLARCHHPLLNDTLVV